jgi:hypothetical protein
MHEVLEQATRHSGHRVLRVEVAEAAGNQESCVGCASHRRPFLYQNEFLPQFETFISLEGIAIYWGGRGDSPLPPLFLLLPLTQ